MNKKRHEDKVEIRRIVIETDGDRIHIAEFNSTPLEMCEICRRLLKFFGGDKYASSQEKGY